MTLAKIFFQKTHILKRILYLIFTSDHGKYEQNVSSLSFSGDF